MVCQQIKRQLVISDQNGEWHAILMILFKQTCFCRFLNCILEVVVLILFVFDRQPANSLE